MQKRIRIKNHYREIQLIIRRVMVVFVLMLVLIACLIARLAYLQIYKNDVYTTLSNQNWLDLVPVEPTRGLIYDRNGVMLAENIPVFSLDIIPIEATDLEKTLAALSHIVTLTDNDISQFRKQLKQHRRFDEIPLKLRLTEEEVARLTENQHRFPGVIVKARLLRYYPYNKSFSHVLGYVGRINAQELKEIDQVNYSASHYIGKLGVEKYYEEELHGSVGYEQVENDASNKPLRVLKEVNGTPGKNIYLTIDSGLQFVAEKALEGHRGAVVAIQPSTGQVLAMVSEPGYDPNIFVLGISQKDYLELQNSPDRPLYNRALRGVYPMASTIKPYLAIGALEMGVITPDVTIYDEGLFELPNSAHIFHDWVKRGHGTVDLYRAIVSSCDIYFYQLAMKMGIHRMATILSQFGFGALTGIDLDDELPGVLAQPEWKRQNRGVNWYPGDTVNASIGQGFMQATPLQLAMAISTMANRGQRFMPYLLLGEQTPGKPYVTQQPIPLESVHIRDGETWDTVIDAMEDVTDTQQGTAYRSFGKTKNYTYTVAGKTGTGAVSRRRNPDEEDKQEQMPEKLRDHHLFIAFAPVDNPKIALAIVSENSNIATETARTIFDYYLGTKPNADRQPEAETKKAAA